MTLYIQIENGRPINHPIIDSNFVEAFPEISTTNLPPQWAVFNRYPQPKDEILPVGVFQKLVVSYALDADGMTWCDKWEAVDLTDQEKADKISLFQSCPLPFPSWSFDPLTCSWEPPVPMPETDGFWMWHENTQTWVDEPPGESKAPLSTVSFI